MIRGTKPLIDLHQKECPFSYTLLTSILPAGKTHFVPRQNAFRPQAKPYTKKSTKNTTNTLRKWHEDKPRAFSF